MLFACKLGQISCIWKTLCPHLPQVATFSSPLLSSQSLKERFLFPRLLQPCNQQQCNAIRPFRRPTTTCSSPNPQAFTQHLSPFCPQQTHPSVALVFSRITYLAPSGAFASASAPFYLRKHYTLRQLQESPKIETCPFKC